MFGLWPSIPCKVSSFGSLEAPTTLTPRGHALWPHKSDTSPHSVIANLVCSSHRPPTVGHRDHSACIIYLVSCHPRLPSHSWRILVSGESKGLKIAFSSSAAFCEMIWPRCGGRASSLSARDCVWKSPRATKEEPEILDLNVEQKGFYLCLCILPSCFLSKNFESLPELVISDLLATHESTRHEPLDPLHRESRKRSHTRLENLFVGAGSPHPLSRSHRKVSVLCGILSTHGYA
jgi:hypothetical protein